MIQHQQESEYLFVKAKLGLGQLATLNFHDFDMLEKVLSSLLGDQEAGKSAGSPAVLRFARDVVKLSFGQPVIKACKNGKQQAP